LKNNRNHTLKQAPSFCLGGLFLNIVCHLRSNLKNKYILSLIGIVIEVVF
jgi:hypothetical protein